MLIRNGIVVLRAHFIGIREVSLTLRPEDETTVHTWHDNSEERDAASRVKAESRIRMVMGNSLGMMATRMNSQIATESWELGDRIRRLEILYIRRSLRWTSIQTAHSFGAQCSCRASSIPPHTSVLDVCGAGKHSVQNGESCFLCTESVTWLRVRSRFTARQ